MLEPIEESSVESIAESIAESSFASAASSPTTLVSAATSPSVGAPCSEPLHAYAHDIKTTIARRTRSVYATREKSHPPRG